MKKILIIILILIIIIVLSTILFLNKIDDYNKLETKQNYNNSVISSELIDNSFSEIPLNATLQKDIEENSIENLSVNCADIGKSIFVELKNNNSVTLYGFTFITNFYKDGTLVDSEEEHINAANDINYTGFAEKGESFYFEVLKTKKDFDSFDYSIKSADFKGVFNVNPDIKELSYEVIKIEKLDSNTVDNIYLKINNPTLNDVYIEYVHTIIKDRVTEEVLNIGEELVSGFICANQCLYAKVSLLRSSDYNINDCNILCTSSGSKNRNISKFDLNNVNVTSKLLDKDIQITIKNLNNEENLYGLAFLIVYNKEGIFQYVNDDNMKYYFENSKNYLEPNEEFSFIVESKYWHNINDFGKIDFDNYQIIVKDVKSY